jgi:hypothetical protein
VVLSVVVGFAAVWLGIIAARKVEHAPVTSHAAYDLFHSRADQHDPAQSPGAETDIRDASIEWHEEQG